VKDPQVPEGSAEGPAAADLFAPPGSNRRGPSVPFPGGERRGPGAEASGEPVWTYRGYKLKASDFNTAMVHMYRAEVARANVWRSRLDSTTNWAVLATGASLSIAFSGATHLGHAIIILNTLMVTLFLLIEARRYRYYELWSYRIRLMETDFFAAMLVPPFRPAPDWADSLAEHLLHPQFPISIWEAVGRRYRYNYLWIYIILALAFLFKVIADPYPTLDWSALLERARMGPLPGWLVLTAGFLFNGALVLIGWLTAGLHQATGEILPRYGVSTPLARGPLQAVRAWFRPARREQTLLTLVITGEATRISRRVLDEMQRGVTALEARGAYTGNPRTLLMCALTAREVTRLKALVHEEDPRALVVVSPAQEVLGSGFRPLEEALAEAIEEE
jgi:uncharacterized membrane protein